MFLIMFEEEKNGFYPFPINPSGALRQMSINNLLVGKSVDETLRLNKAFQFVEKHGEVCPAIWTPLTPPPSSPKAHLSTLTKSTDARMLVHVQKYRCAHDHVC